MTQDIYLSRPNQPDSNKDNLLLIHGWAFNSAIWQYNLDHLSTNFNIYTLDLNGHGNSNFNEKYLNLDFYISQITKILPDKINIIGWSLGGIIALLLKQKAPQQIHRVILCCSTPLFKSNQSWSYGIEPTVWDNFSNKLLENPEKTIKEFLLLNTINHKHSKDLYKSLSDIMLQSKTASLSGLEWGLNILDQDYRDILNLVNHEDLHFIFAGKDKLINKELSEWLTSNFPKIKISHIKKSGHMPFITNQPDFYQKINNFE